MPEAASPTSGSSRPDGRRGRLVRRMGPPAPGRSTEQHQPGQSDESEQVPGDPGPLGRRPGVVQLDVLRGRHDDHEVRRHAVRTLGPADRPVRVVGDLHQDRHPGARDVEAHRVVGAARPRHLDLGQPGALRLSRHRSAGTRAHDAGPSSASGRSSASGVSHHAAGEALPRRQRRVASVRRLRPRPPASGVPKHSDWVPPWIPVATTGSVRQRLHERRVAHLVDRPPVGRLAVTVGDGRDLLESGVRVGLRARVGRVRRGSSSRRACGGTRTPRSKSVMSR